MKANTFIALLAFSVLFTIGFSAAADAACTFDVNSKTTTDFLNEIPTINTALGSCPVPMPGSFAFLIGGTRTVLIKVSTGEQVSVQIVNSQISGIVVGASGAPSHTLTIERCKLDAILSANDRLGALSYYWTNGGFTIVANNAFDKIKLWLANLFIGGAVKKAAVKPTENCGTIPVVGGQAASGPPQNKPTNCYETYMEGHKEYQFAKKTWDEWKAKTKGVCQTQTSEPPKGGKCEWTFEQIQGGDKKWLCWYN